MPAVDREQLPVESLGLVHPLRDMEPDELVEKAKQVRQMVESPGWRFVVELLEEYERGILHEPIQAQAILSKAQYADMFGRVAGLRAALSLPKAIELLGRGAEEELRRAVENGEE